MLKFRWKVAALAILTVAPLVGGAVVYSQSDSAAVANAAEVATGTFDGPLAVHADVSARQLTVYAGDEAVRSYPVAVGKPSYPTPKGTYKIRKIVWNPSWTPPPNSEWAKNKTAKDPGEKGNPMKVVKIFFREPDYYIHGTNETETLGKAASHGCLRMAPGDAAEVARYLMEHGGQPRDPTWFERLRNFRSKEKIVYLKYPITIRITS